MPVELSSAKYFHESSENRKEKEFAIQIKDADWTKGLTTMCFLCVLFGVWGMGTAAYRVQDILAASSTPTFNHGQVTYEQLQLIHAAQKVETDYKLWRLCFYSAKFCLSVTLLASAAIMLMKLPFARTWMLYTCGAAIAFHVAGSALGCAMFVALSSQIEEASRMTLYKYASGMQNVDGIVNQYMNGVAFGTLIGTFLALLLKAGVYVRMMLFLNTPFVRAIFAEDPYPEYDEMLGSV